MAMKITRKKSVGPLTEDHFGISKTGFGFEKC